MLSLKKIRDRGFTIVELLIVIVVIGILATLVITTYNGVQQKARDTKRKTDINAVQGQVEAYNTENGHYPSLADMNTASFRTANMKGLDPSALQDPKWTSSVTACTASGAVTLATAPQANCYSYQPVNSSGASCEADDTTCASYTLTATLEGGGTYQKTGSN